MLQTAIFQQFHPPTCWCCVKRLNDNQAIKAKPFETSERQQKQEFNSLLLLDAAHVAQLTASKHTHTHTRLMALFLGLPGWAGTRKVKPIWILLKQETVNGSGISWAICTSAPCSKQITTPAPHHSVFYKPDALPAAQPTASKH